MLRTPGSARTWSVKSSICARVDGEPYRDHRLERAAQRAQVDLGVEAADDPRLAQRADPRQARGGGEPDLLGEAVVRDPGVDAQVFEDRPIERVKLRKIRHQRQ